MYPRVCGVHLDGLLVGVGRRSLREPFRHQLVERKCRGRASYGLPSERDLFVHLRGPDLSFVDPSLLWIGECDAQRVRTAQCTCRSCDRAGGRGLLIFAPCVQILSIVTDGGSDGDPSNLLLYVALERAFRDAQVLRGLARGEQSVIVLPAVTQCAPGKLRGQCIWLQARGFFGLGSHHSGRGRPLDRVCDAFERDENASCGVEGHQTANPVRGKSLLLRRGDRRVRNPAGASVRARQ